VQHCLDNRGPNSSQPAAEGRKTMPRENDCLCFRSRSRALSLDSFISLYHLISFKISEKGSAMFKFDDDKTILHLRIGIPRSCAEPEQVAGAGRLMGFLSADPEISNIRWAAYMLTTVKHECADTWTPIAERGYQCIFAATMLIPF